MKTLPKKIFWLICLVVWMAFMFSLSSKPGLSSGLSWDYFLRKIAHMVEYGILTFLVYKNIQHPRIPKRRQFLAAFLFAVLYAASDELHQHYVPNRHGTPFDLIYDSLGSVVMIILVAQWQKIQSFFKGKK